MLSNGAGPCEQSLVHWSFLKNVLSCSTISVKKTKIILGKAAVMEEPYKLFQGHAGLHIGLDKDLISHE